MRRLWEILVRLVHNTFLEWTPPAELVWATILLIREGKGEYQGIGLIEVAWKVCAALVDCWLKRGVVLQNNIHGFREGG